MQRIKIKTTSEYEVLIENNLIESCGKYVAEIFKPCTAVIVTDDTVDLLYADKVSASLKDYGFKIKKFVFKNGESSKNLDNYCKIVNFIAEREITRSDIIIALGGGVVGDIAGFAAATYLRGIKFVQIPTTLLAMIDSSVGGKTGVNLDSGKNLLGQFYQPSLVLCDPLALSTLKEEQMKEGYAEMVKYVILYGKELLGEVLKQKLNYENIIKLCVEIKNYYVSGDEREDNLRMFLNLGHTPAHAVEKLSGYNVPHGRTVGMGLKIIAKSCLNAKILSAEGFEKIINLLNKFKINYDCPYQKEKVIAEIAFDKKRRGDLITFVTIEDIGKCAFKQVKVKYVGEFLVL